MQDSSLSLQQTLANTTPRFADDTPCAVMHTGLGRRAAEQTYATVLDQPYRPRVTVPCLQQQFRWLVLDSTPALDFMFVGACLLCDYYTWPANNNNNNNNMFLPPLLFTMKVAQIPKFGNYNFGQLKI